MFCLFYLSVVATYLLVKSWLILVALVRINVFHESLQLRRMDGWALFYYFGKHALYVLCLASILFPKEIGLLQHMKFEIRTVDSSGRTEKI